MSDKPISIDDRLAEFRRRKAEREAASQSSLSQPDVNQEDVVENPYPGKSEEDESLDNIINRLDVLAVYRRWIEDGGKVVNEKTTGKREGVQVSCPNPEHPDKHPSAWLNLDKGTWFCGGCNEGGDIYDLAAIKFGYTRPDYKEGKAFHDLRRSIGEDFGLRFKKLLDGTTQVYREDSNMSEVSESLPNDTLDTDDKLRSSPDSSSLSSDNSDSDKTDTNDNLDSSNVSQMFAEDEDTEEIILWPDLPWREIVPEDTFLYEYCETTSNDDSPEEYHFFHGLLGLSHVAGRRVTLDDTRPVYGNLLICLLGGTGSGKSRSKGWLDQVIHKVMPFKDNGLDCEGVKIVSPPASGEYLIKQFQHIARDPSLGKNATETLTPVNGIVDFDEFSGLLSRANRAGNVLKPVIMSFADARDQVATGSLASGDIKAVAPFCSITSSTQPRAVRAILSKNDAGSGFLNRWVFVGGKRKEREVIGGSRSRIRVDLTQCIDTLRNVKAWASVERSIQFTDEGFDAINNFYKLLVFPTQANDDSDLLKRLDLLFKRLILLFCINERKMFADDELVDRVARLFDYIVFCYSAINAEIGITQMTEISQEILRHVTRHHQKTNRGASVRDLQMYMKRKNYGPDLLKKALETMIALEQIEIEKKNSSMGRPTTRYVEVI